jgi:hypothetical protein
MDMRATPVAGLPPIALEAMLKLLTVGQVGAARREFAESLPADAKPALRLEGAPATPAWPGVSGRIEVPRGAPGRPRRRAPDRHDGHDDTNRDRQAPRRDQRLLMGE